MILVMEDETKAERRAAEVMGRALLLFQTALEEMRGKEATKVQMR